MPPSSAIERSSCVSSIHDSLLETAAVELKAMSFEESLLPMPTACFNLIKSLPGNRYCLDCGSSNPEWAAVSYGALVCLECSGRHRSLGVKTSCVRSLSMDHWSQEQVLSMLEGGNTQLHSFFHRHALTSKNVEGHSSSTATARYRTKAARFYREQMAAHVHQVLQAGMYQGREASRQLHRHVDTAMPCQTSRS